MRDNERRSLLMDSKKIKIIGVAVSLIGAGATLVSNWIDGKQIDNKIAETVSKAVSEKLEQK